MISNINQKKGKTTILKKNFRIYFFIIIFLVIAGIILFLILLLHRNPFVSSLKTCGDGSFYSTCSLDKPYYCDSGLLVENAKLCGCPSGLAEINNVCHSNYQFGEKNSSFVYFLNGKEGAINLSLYKGLVDYVSSIPESITYSSGQTFQRSDFVLKKLNNINQSFFLESLVKKIENAAPNSKVDQARIAISLVQNIPWGSSGKKIDFAGTSVDYSRYPYQVLYDDQGLCGEKSDLLAFVLRDLGYGVVLFYYPDQNHEALGIKCPVQDSLDGTGYCFVETSGPAIISDSHLVYENGITLSSPPQITLISNGISLPTGLPEYKDAKTMDSLRNRVFLDPISEQILNNLKKKYGLLETYNVT